MSVCVLPSPQAQQMTLQAMTLAQQQTQEQQRKMEQEKKLAERRQSRRNDREPSPPSSSPRPRPPSPLPTRPKAPGPNHISSYRPPAPQVRLCVAHHLSMRFFPHTLPSTEQHCTTLTATEGRGPTRAREPAVLQRQEGLFPEDR